MYLLWQFFLTQTQPHDTLNFFAIIFEHLFRAHIAINNRKGF
ncbi:unnamed protein product [Acanthoscelides obtectus]|uniref:Uncharacterized protein n=1 Tax=Acanthoscelides obtectus TaxID=200917 RepID=A0A9P0LBP0_ACAOB|nr:unnamed protein product [Acanthoscelides obtectus]CAK1629575.1 hypothetical protein AOBTE_LOCUS5826 [Acanthoscelides obtectus]